MTETSTFLCLSAGWWEAIGTWLAAAGTVGAIFSALYVARRDDRVRIRITATVGQLAFDPVVPLKQLHLWITVTNLGRRSFMLQTVGWRSGVRNRNSGFLHRVHAVQLLEGPNDATLPRRMQDGDVVNWMVPLDEWLVGVDKIVAKPHWLGLRTLRIEAYASTGDVVRSRVSQNLLEKIRGKLK